jgi:hypothetical protein
MPGLTCPEAAKNNRAAALIIFPENENHGGCFSFSAFQVSGVLDDE